MPIKFQRTWPCVPNIKDTDKKQKEMLFGISFILLRRLDSNERPPGYEPGELPTAPLRDVVFWFECKSTAFPETDKENLRFFHFLAIRKRLFLPPLHIIPDNFLGFLRDIGITLFQYSVMTKALRIVFLGGENGVNGQYGVNSSELIFLSSSYFSILRSYLFTPGEKAWKRHRKTAAIRHVQQPPQR